MRLHWEMNSHAAQLLLKPSSKPRSFCALEKFLPEAFDLLKLHFCRVGLISKSSMHQA